MPIAEQKYHIFSALGRLGRLGNQLWQIASVMGLADKDKAAARFNPNWEYKPYFSVPDEYFEIVPVSAPVQDYHNDYMQRYRDWQHMGELIRAYLQPSELAIDELQLYYAEPLVMAPYSLSVHVRLGDYLALSKLFVQLRGDYYRRAIDMAQTESGLDVMVFSDNPALAAEIVPGAAMYVRPSGQSYRPEVCELLLMAMCQRHVIANSTFSWWGAYLADGQKVVYPDQWAYPELELYHRWRQLIPEDRRWSSCPVENG